MHGRRHCRQATAGRHFRVDQPSWPICVRHRGAFVTVVIEEVVSEAHKPGEESRIATIALVGGVARFALLAAYLG